MIIMDTNALNAMRADQERVRKLVEDNKVIIEPPEKQGGWCHVIIPFQKNEAGFDHRAGIISFYTRNDTENYDFTPEQIEKIKMGEIHAHNHKWAEYDMFTVRAIGKPTWLDRLKTFFVHAAHAITVRLHGLAPKDKR